MKHLKRILAILAAALLVAGLLGGCNYDASGPVNSPADFEGKKIAVQTETTASDSISELKNNENMRVKVYEYPKITQCFDDLAAGRVAAVYVDSVVAAYYTSGKAEYTRTWISDVPEPMGICLRKDSESLAAAIEAALDMLNYNGRMQEIAQKNFGEDFTANLRTVVEEPVIPTGFTTTKPGVLAVGSEVAYPPMEYVDKDGATPIGFDIDVAYALGEVLGLEVEIRDTAWEGIFAGLETAQYDLIISAISITPERQEKYILTEPYVANALCIVTRTPTE